MSDLEACRSCVSTCPPREILGWSHSAFEQRKIPPTVAFTHLQPTCNVSRASPWLANVT